MQSFTLFAATCKQTFFGLIPWYQYLKLDNNCNVVNFQVLPNGKSPGSLTLILVAVVDDLLRIAGIVAVGFLIYASFQYITSQGNPDQAAKAMSTIINALVGLAISLVAIAFVSYLGSVLK